ncbi:hypothetical protein [Streptomyces sp. NPDC058382]|uniref:hypothetical protein n=1 Tax=unclassified Streptomyces TaxID=2593676 RepID=UPI00362575CE
MSGGSGWGSGNAGHIPPGHGPGGRSDGGGGSLFPLVRSWAVGALVHLVAGYLLTRGLVELLATDERLDVFTWRLALVHVPAIITTVVAVLAAARVLPDEQRSSRPLYALATLTVPVVALGYGYAVSWDVVGTEDVLMPVVALVTGVAVGLAVDRLMEDDGVQSPAPGSYNWRDGGATAMEYLGVIVLVVTMAGGMTMAGVGGSIAHASERTSVKGTGTTGVVVAGVHSKEVPFSVRIATVK